MFEPVRTVKPLPYVSFGQRLETPTDHDIVHSGNHPSPLHTYRSFRLLSSPSQFIYTSLSRGTRNYPKSKIKVRVESESTYREPKVFCGSIGIFLKRNNELVQVQVKVLNTGFLELTLLFQISLTKSSSFSSEFRVEILNDRTLESS